MKGAPESFWPDDLSWDQKGELLAVWTPRWWRTPRVCQIVFGSTSMRRKRAKDFDDEIDATISRHIRAYRIFAGLRQVDLAAAIGVNAMTISRIERGSQPVTPGQLMRIAIQLKKPIEAFFLPPPDDELETGWERVDTTPTIPHWLMTIPDQEIDDDDDETWERFDA